MTEEIKEMIEKEINNNNFELNKLQIAEMYDYITNLQKENENYKQRNEKAIEYIKSLKNYRFEFTFDSVNRHEIVGCEKNFVKDLLNILKGGDE